ncbi:MAG TPA: 50S ribosomal protein L11 methyltransferase [Casimicrobiaceae bacterium]|nr:50S ribosomal protein L11 methyltransferase [Casimicrobiaceae bacterium]
MSFIALRFDASAVQADAWSDALLEAGALSVDVSDPFAGTDRETPLYGEPGTDSDGAWATSRLVALLAADADLARLLDGAARSVGLPIPAFETYPVADEDWVRNTQAQFGPIEIAQHFFIVPSWCAPPDPGALNIRLDPGLAFGTGSHPTTRLCLAWLRETIAGGETVLDYGCGSGILAIAAAKLGARAVTGVDVDPQALAASRANAAGNGVGATFASPDALAPGRFGIVVANILANPLVLLAPVIAARVEAGGSVALSGVLADQAEAVVAAYARWFTLAATREDGGWVLLSSR